MEINPVEYKLTGGEFKLLQYLKSQVEAESVADIAAKCGLSDRHVRKAANMLEAFSVIKIERAGIIGQKKVNKYYLEDVENWRIQ